MSLFARVAEDLVDTGGERLTLCNASRDPTGGFGLSSLLWWSVRMELQERSLSMDGNHTERGAAQLGCISLAFSTDTQDPLRHDFIEYSLERATAELENDALKSLWLGRKNRR